MLQSKRDQEKKMIKIKKDEFDGLKKRLKDYQKELDGFKK